jgi:hypothetical protein
MIDVKPPFSELFVSRVVRAVSRVAFSCAVTFAGAMTFASWRSASAHDRPVKPVPLLITTAAEIRGMTVGQAQENHAVSVTGVITYYDPEEPDLFVQDATGGIWVSLEVVKPTVAIRAGDVVEVQGVTEAPDFAPQIGSPRIKVIWRAPLSPARRVSFAQMTSTKMDSQRVEVEGIVHKVSKQGQHLYLEVTTEGGPVTGRIPFYTEAVLPNLVDALVRLRGTCGAQFNSMNQLTGVFINIPYPSEMEIVRPPPADALYAGHVQQLGGANPLPNLMEVKG